MGGAPVVVAEADWADVSRFWGEGLLLVTLGAGWLESDLTNVSARHSPPAHSKP